MKSRHRLWHGRLWVSLSILIVLVLVLAVILRPKPIPQDLGQLTSQKSN
ncbi:MAG: hypothetical protein HAW63_03850 [Bdellovibrionaceae bacterium]|nr:hypothetical protein [Pseudobdellovibrionaceae bacterium]